MADPTAMRIVSVHKSHVLTTAQATVAGQRFEFTSYNGGAWEVYDHPASWGGVARFVGYLPNDTARKLEAILFG